MVAPIEWPYLKASIIGGVNWYALQNRKFSVACETNLPISKVRVSSETYVKEIVKHVG